ncbi:MAG: TatD family hydrolase [Mycoplasmatales bacterium]
MIIETHAHINHEQFLEDYEQIIKRAEEAGINKIIDIGCDQKSRSKTLMLSQTYKNIYSAIGLHPVDVEEWDEQLITELRQHATTNTKIVAIGEIGLDYHWYPETKEQQKKIFEKQIELAQELELPIIIHSREANDDTFKILEKYKPIKGVMHSFAGDYEDAIRFTQLGMYIGISGPVTFKNGLTQQDVTAKLDLQRLVIETDCPFLTPVPYRGKRNEPSYLQYIIEKISELRIESKEEIEKQLYANSIALFERLKNE